jgi:hypothetical protein
MCAAVTAAAWDVDIPAGMARRHVNRQRSLGRPVRVFRVTVAAGIDGRETYAVTALADATPADAEAMMWERYHGDWRITALDVTHEFTGRRR